MNPSGRITVTTETQSVSRFKLYGYGEDPRVPNEGDLLLISDSYLNEAGKIEKIELELLLRGKDLWMFSEKLQGCLAMYEANKDYLSQPATRVIDVPSVLPDASSARRSVQLLDDLGRRARLDAPPKLLESRADLRAHTQ